jgi:hypothetical protein
MDCLNCEGYYLMSSDQSSGFELPSKLEKILAYLATYYGDKNLPLLQQLVTNSSYNVKEEWTFDNWNGGAYGHAIFFRVPSIIFNNIFETKDSISNKLRDDINKTSNVQNEFISEVFFELQDNSKLENWRQNSEALIKPSQSSRFLSNEQLAGLWEPGFFRLFVSHKAEIKIQASIIKNALLKYGVSCFIAHEDIKPNKEWLNEIERALFSMDALLALMTEDFSDSDWTDQEIGIAMGRQIPVIPVRLGRNPYGFIGKYQALSGDLNNLSILSTKIYDLLWTIPELKDSLSESLIAAFEYSNSFQQAKTLVKELERLSNVSPHLVDRIENAPKENRQVREAFGVESHLSSIIKKLRTEG